MIELKHWKLLGTHTNTISYTYIYSTTILDSIFFFSKSFGDNKGKWRGNSPQFAWTCEACFFVISTSSFYQLIFFFFFFLEFLIYSVCFWWYLSIIRSKNQSIFSIDKNWIQISYSTIKYFILKKYYLLFYFSGTLEVWNLFFFFFFF